MRLEQSVGGVSGGMGARTRPPRALEHSDSVELPEKVGMEMQSCDSAVYTR